MATINQFYLFIPFSQHGTTTCGISTLLQRPAASGPGAGKANLSRIWPLGDWAWQTAVVFSFGKGWRTKKSFFMSCMQLA